MRNNSIKRNFDLIPFTNFFTGRGRKFLHLNFFSLLKGRSYIFLIVIFAIFLTSCNHSTDYQSCSVPDDLLAKYPDSEILNTDFSDRINAVLRQAEDNEPIGNWREKSIEGAKPLLAKMEDSTDPRAVRKACSQVQNSWVQFKTKIMNARLRWITANRYCGKIRTY